MTRLRRSLLITPGHRRERLEKALGLDADCLVFDLEDGVPPAQKAAARQHIAAVLREGAVGRRERLVRINAVGSEEWKRDLDALPWDCIDAALVPKVERASEVPGAAPVDLILSLETPRGVLSALAIADSSPRCVGLFFGPGDYTLQTGGAMTQAGLAMPRAVVAAAAGAVGAQAIDAPYLADIKDAAATQDDALVARELGYSGKLVFHPAQLAAVNAAFTPSAAEVTRAERFVRAYEAAQAQGNATAYVDGEFVAMDLVPRMQAIIKIAREAERSKNNERSRAS